MANKDEEITNQILERILDKIELNIKELSLIQKYDEVKEDIEYFNIKYGTEKLNKPYSRLIFGYNTNENTYIMNEEYIDKSYDYDFDSIEGLVFAKELHKKDIPEYEWVIKVTKIAVTIIRNIIKNISNNVYNSAYQKLKNLSKQIKAIIKNIRNINIKEIKNNLTNIFNIIFDSSDNINEQVKYTDIFKTIQQPNFVVKNWENDEHFLSCILVGPNPIMLKDATDSDLRELGNDFQIDKEESLFTVSFEEIEKLEEAENKFLPKPKLFLKYKKQEEGIEVWKGWELLAIQLRSENNILVKCSEKNDWKVAKMAFSTTYSNHHELISHLALTHLLIEPFVVATYRRLPNYHPLYVLLTPHFKGTSLINRLAVDVLINKGGPIDKLLSGKLKSGLIAVAESLNAKDFALRYLDFDNNIQKLPKGVYPYKDASKLLWDSIKKWVNEYLKIFYDNEAHKDTITIKWAEELSQKVNGFKVPKTHDELVDILTMVVFTASVQHAAVNFPQDQMIFTPAFPLSNILKVDLENDLYEHLPLKQMALLQLHVLYLLSSVNQRKLGDDKSFEWKNLKDKQKQAINCAINFKKDLENVEEKIIKMNEILPPHLKYEYLLPSKIPQSINI